ncbi:hypothetical protein KFZ56_03460 [Virgibacillus sp. NKC19-3]|uniref:hypothetical protein n=1 Tax=Virgibacillus saliphilus TaxID=2831674 RepID=UPI001C9B62D2|nr:hypothetical protein [Virgibacillus sp. NKC19-3]MBY7142163.1 hypothetical protein [Virgibacillus sp. NKC19-3]
MSTAAYFIWGIALIVSVGSAVILHKNRKDNGDVSKKGMKLFWMLLTALFIVIIVVITNDN